MYASIEIPLEFYLFNGSELIFPIYAPIHHTFIKPLDSNLKYCNENERLTHLKYTNIYSRFMTIFLLALTI